MDIISDEQICSNICGSKCCKSTPPALTEEDFKRIEAILEENDWYKSISQKSKHYVVNKKKNLIDCYFLTESGLCRIYDHRPLDCILFPLVLKIKQLEEKKYQLRWYIWYCPLTERREKNALLQKASKLIKEYLAEKPEVIFNYQETMYESGGYKKKHFFEEELIIVKSKE